MIEAIVSNGDFHWIRHAPFLEFHVLKFWDVEIIQNNFNIGKLGASRKIMIKVSSNVSNDYKLIKLMIFSHHCMLPERKWTTKYIDDVLHFNLHRVGFVNVSYYGNARLEQVLKMDRVHPKDTAVAVPIEAFVFEPIVLKEISRDRDTDEDATVLELDSLESDPKSLAEDEDQEPPPPTPTLNIPKIVITKEIELSPTESDGQPFPQFEELMNTSKFMLSYTSKSNAKVFTPNGVILFKCTYPSNSYWEGCHPDAMEKVVEILEFRTSRLIMQLRHQTLPCHSCFEEETNSIDLLGPDERLLATIIQKKTWVNTKINRDIIVRPGPYGKSDTYKAQFTWSDASMNFKPHRSGIIVATLITDCQETPHTSDYVLQFLREIRPRDKAMLIGVMIARDVLMADETQTRDIVERATLFIVVLGFILLFLFVFLPSRD